jgi:P4 family phage/plasmid primase-like protien
MTTTNNATIPICTSLKSVLTNDAEVNHVNVESLISSLLNNTIPECYELIYYHREIKPYFDLDIKREAVTNFDDLYNNKQIVLNEHLDYLRTLFDNPTFAISSCHRKDKISFHITINNFRTHMRDLYNLSRCYKSKYKNIIFFDTSVYNRDAGQCARKYRTILSKKGGETPQKLIPETFQDDNQLSEHFINHVNNSTPVFTYNVVEETTTPQPQQTDETTEEVNDNLTIGDILINNETIAYDEWLKIGISLYCVMPDKAKEEFLKYSKRHSSFNAKSFHTTWNGIINNAYKNGGWNLLRKYTPAIYIKRFIKSAPLPLDANDYDIAKYILDTYDGFPITTVYVNETTSTGKQWYIFKEHRWQRSQEVTIRKEMIHLHLYKRYNIHIKEMEEAKTIATDDVTKNNLTEKIKKLHKALSSIKSVKKCSSIMDTIFGEYLRPKFKELLDQNSNILGFLNGVYDLEKREFRAGREEDLISISCNWHYTTDYDKERMEELKKIISQICCDKEDLYKCLLTYLAHHLKGDNSKTHQFFHCWWGKGSNGKSTISTLLQHTLGDYFQTLPSSFLTQKCGRSDGTTNDIAKLVGSRFVTCSEMEQNVPINIRTLKNISGEDKIAYRANFESMRETKITWTLFLMTNEKVQLPMDDYGTIRRFRYTPFNAKFVDDPMNYEGDGDGDRKYYQKGDALEKASKGYFQCEFMNLLIENLINPLVFPQWMKDTTKEMIRSQDNLYNILDNLIEPCDESSNINGELMPYGISWTDLKKQMRRDRQFYKLEFNSDSALYDKVVDRMPKGTRIWKAKYVKPYACTLRNDDDYSGNVENKKQSRNCFFGIKIRDDKGQDDEEEEDCII